MTQLTDMQIKYIIKPFILWEVCNVIEVHVLFLRKYKPTAILGYFIKMPIFDLTPLSKTNWSRRIVGLVIV